MGATDGRGCTQRGKAATKRVHVCLDRSTTALGDLAALREIHLPTHSRDAILDEISSVDGKGRIGDLARHVILSHVVIVSRQDAKTPTTLGGMPRYCLMKKVA